MHVQICDFTCTWINLMYILPELFTSVHVSISILLHCNWVAVYTPAHAKWVAIPSQSQSWICMYIYYVAGYSACSRSAPELVTTTRQLAIRCKIDGEKLCKANNYKFDEFFLFIVFLNCSSKICQLCRYKAIYTQFSSLIPQQISAIYVIHESDTQVGMLHILAIQCVEISV